MDKLPHGHQQMTHAGLPERASGPDALRGLASMGVVLHHMAHFSPSAQGPVYLFAKSFLGLGVPLFFMISAFAMMSRYGTSLTTKSAMWTYSLRRVMRIYPLYLVMLGIFLVSHNTIGQDWTTGTKFAVFTAYASLLFGLIPSIAHGMVWASWSISVEVLFYFLFPIIVRLAPKLFTLFGIAIVGLVCNFFISPMLTPQLIGAPWYWAVAWHLYIPFFALGLSIYRLKYRFETADFNSSRMLHCGIVISLLIAPIVLKLLGWPFDSSGNAIPERYVNLLLASTFPLFFLMLLVTLKPPRFMVNKITIFLGKISLSIYLLHPLLVFELIPIYAFIQENSDNGTLNFVFSASITYGILIPLAVLSYRWIEAPAVAFARRVTS